MGALGTAGVLFPAAKLPLAGFWLLIMGEDPDLDLQHPAVFHLGDSDIQPLRLEVIAHLRDLAHLLHDPAETVAASQVPLTWKRSYISSKSAEQAMR